MKVLIAVKGTEWTGFFDRVVDLAHLDRVDEIVIAHVTDVGPRADIELGRERFMTRRPLGRERAAKVAAAEQEHAGAGLRRAREALVAAGVPSRAIREVTLTGKPREELQRLARSESVDLVIVGGRPGQLGPHSLGKTARFLVDHAPGSALLVK